jgi:hypothetical protein
MEPMMLNTNTQFQSNVSNIEAMLEAFFCVQANEHVKAWKWHCYSVKPLNDAEFVDTLLKGLRHGN